MLAFLFKKISMNAKNSLKWIKDICVCNIPNNGMNKIKQELRPLTEFLLNGKFVSAKILNYAPKIPWARCAAEKEVVSLTKKYGSFDSTKQQLVPLVNHLYTDIRLKPVYPKHSITPPAIYYASNKHTCKRIGQSSNRNKQSKDCEPEIPAIRSTQPSISYQKSAAQEAHQKHVNSCRETSTNDCRDAAKDANDEYSYTIQSATPSYANKPERYGGQRTPIERSDETKQVSKDLPKRNAEPCQDRRKDSMKRVIKKPAHDIRDKKYIKFPDDPMFRVGKPKDSVTKIKKFVSYVQEHSCSAFTVKSKTKHEKSWENSCRESVQSFDVPCEEKVQPDPPPPKSVHWTQRKQHYQRYAKACPARCSAPIVFVPYERPAVKRTEKREVLRPSKQRTWSRDSSSCSKCPPTCPCQKAPANRAPQTTASCKPKVKCVVSFDASRNKCFEIPAATKDTKSEASFLAYGSSSYSKPGKAFKMKDVVNSKPNVSTLKHRLSKCPDIKEMWKRDECKADEPPKKFLRRQATCSTKRRKLRYKCTGEWKKQRYPVRLRIFKVSNSLDPCPPLVTEVRRGNRCFLEMVKKPRLSPVHREIVKLLRNPCPPQYCPGVDIEKTKRCAEGSKQRKRKEIKRLRRCLWRS